MRTLVHRAPSPFAPPASQAPPTLDDCRVIDVPPHTEQRQRLAAIERSGLVPFTVDRMFWVSGLPSGSRRGGHANDLVHELIVCVAGAVRVTVDDGEAQREFALDAYGHALYLPPGLWSGQEAIADGTTYVVLTNLTQLDALAGRTTDYGEYRTRCITRGGARAPLA